MKPNQTMIISSEVLVKMFSNDNSEKSIEMLNAIEKMKKDILKQARQCGTSIVTLCNFFDIPIEIETKYEGVLIIIFAINFLLTFILSFTLMVLFESLLGLVFMMLIIFALVIMKLIRGEE